MDRWSDDISSSGVHTQESTDDLQKPDAPKNASAASRDLELVTKPRKEIRVQRANHSFKLWRATNGSPSYKISSKVESGSEIIFWCVNTVERVIPSIFLLSINLRFGYCSDNSDNVEGPLKRLSEKIFQSIIWWSNSEITVWLSSTTLSTGGSG